MALSPLVGDHSANILMIVAVMLMALQPTAPLVVILILVVAQIGFLVSDFRNLRRVKWKFYDRGFDYQVGGVYKRVSYAEVGRIKYQLGDFRFLGPEFSLFGLGRFESYDASIEVLEEWQRKSEEFDFEFDMEKARRSLVEVTSRELEPSI